MNYVKEMLGITKPSSYVKYLYPSFGLSGYASNAEGREAALARGVDLTALFTTIR